MIENIRCDKCGETFSPTKKQRRFLEESKRKGMSFIMLECSACGRMVSVNPVSLGEEHEANNKAEIVPTRPLRCPVSGCSGWVTFVEPIGGEKPFWGCGECGAVWYNKSKLYSEIKKIVKKYPYRSHSYIRKEGEWLPAPLDQEDKHYEDLVEKEPKEMASDYVRG